MQPTTFDPQKIRAKYVELSREQDVEFDPRKPRKRSRRQLNWLESLYEESKSNAVEAEEPN